ncbi:SPOR domain-containing protein [Streptomyces sp. NBC_00233]|uniref:SPOR domain-containing protein n=1 Tax=Streptomyces sp. NBC_00233 TaxID=2975686 RepID=UPI0022520091|nr:hypothetical protein [Streptomyces sp. NBC_00233]MCX5233560.1 hypothetical protein [Streptomyces sp. NBC_00233]
MDEFEMELVRMLHVTQGEAPYGSREREELHSAIRRRRRARAVGGSAFAAGMLGLAAFVLPNAMADSRPSPAVVASAPSVPAAPSGQSAPPSAKEPSPALTPGQESPVGELPISPRKPQDLKVGDSLILQVPVWPDDIVGRTVRVTGSAVVDGHPSVTVDDGRDLWNCLGTGIDGPLTCSKGQAAVASAGALK